MSNILVSALAKASAVPTEWYLEGCLAENSAMTQLKLKSDRVTIGRDPGSDICIEAGNVSKRHAELLVVGNLIFLQDLNSTNGSYINGRRVTSSTPVSVNDLLQFADMEFRLGRTNSRPLTTNTWVADRPEEGWLMSRMHEVIQKRRFFMAFQTIVAAQGMQSTAVEALVRCNVSGLETPYKLFDAAVRLGQEDRISEMCRIAAVESLQGISDSQDLFLNTHPNELLGPSMVESLKHLRDQAGDRRLVLEIHEAAIPELETIREFRNALKDLGIGLAYDDFGAGQSRLRELVEVPPDFLKFDRSLLLNLESASSSHLALIRSLVSVATQAGVQTIAEGLDEFSSVEICKQLGFTHFQGFCLSRPVPASDLFRK